MRSFILVSAFIAVALARPEYYKEKEDFEYSRSSSDDGTKAGFYNAQRGNIGGNYEKAHNMDDVAQKQMSTAVRNVEGEFGDLSHVRAGNVFTSANTKGIYGDKLYDLTNLQGRNFAENAGFSEHNQHYTSGVKAFNQGYQYGGAQNQHYTSGVKSSNGGLNYGGRQYDGISENLVADNTGVVEESSHSSKTHSESSSYKRHQEPIRIQLRPQSTANVAVGAEILGTGSHSSLIDRNENSGFHDHGSIPGGSKNYQTSYNYRKEWEKHNTYPAPLSVPLENPHPAHSEHSEDWYDSHSQYANHAQNTQSRYTNGYNQQQFTKGGAGYNTHNADLSAALTDYEVKSAAPKSYESSYAYHKSWERHGDPYEIKPVSETSQRLTESSQKNSYDCETYCKNIQHSRAKRSPTYHHDHQQQGQADWSNLEDLGQHTQTSWDDNQNVLAANMQQQQQRFGQSPSNRHLNLQYGVSNAHRTPTSQYTQKPLHENQNLQQEQQQQFGQYHSQNRDVTQQVQQQTHWPNYGTPNDRQSSTYNRPHHQSRVESHDNLQSRWDRMPPTNRWSNGRYEDFSQQAQGTWDEQQAFGQQTEDLTQSSSPGFQSGNHGSKHVTIPNDNRGTNTTNIIEHDREYNNAFMMQNSQPNFNDENDKRISGNIYQDTHVALESNRTNQQNNYYQSQTSYGHEYSVFHAENNRKLNKASSVNLQGVHDSKEQGSSKLLPGSFYNDDKAVSTTNDLAKNISVINHDRGRGDIQAYEDQVIYNPENTHNYDNSFGVIGLNQPSQQNKQTIHNKTNLVSQSTDQHADKVSHNGIDIKLHQSTVDFINFEKDRDSNLYKDNHDYSDDRTQEFVQQTQEGWTNWDAQNRDRYSQQILQPHNRASDAELVKMLKHGSKNQLSGTSTHASPKIISQTEEAKYREDQLSAVRDVEEITEKPGFWKSVQSKISNLFKGN